MNKAAFISWRWEQETWKICLAFIFLFLLLEPARFAPPFCDEAENLAGGMACAHGLVLYRDLFVTHMPLAQWLMAPVYPLFGTHPAGYRWAMIFYWCFILGICRRHAARAKVPVSLICLALWMGLSSYYFLGHMVLYHQFATGGLLILAGFWRRDWVRFPPTSGDAMLIGLGSVLALGSNPMAILPWGLFLCIIFMQIHGLEKARRTRFTGKVIAAIFLPAFIILCYLVWTHSFAPFFQCVYIVNRDYAGRYYLTGFVNLLWRQTIVQNARFFWGLLGGPPQFNRDLIHYVFGGMNLLALGWMARTYGWRAASYWFVVLLLGRLRGVGDHMDGAYYWLSGWVIAMLMGAQIENLVQAARNTYKKPVLANLAGPLFLKSLPLVFFFWGTVGLACGWYLWSTQWVRDYNITWELPNAKALTRDILEPGERVTSIPLQPTLVFLSNHDPAGGALYYLHYMADYEPVRARFMRSLQQQEATLLFTDWDDHIWGAFVPADYAAEAMRIVVNNYMPIGQCQGYEVLVANPKRSRVESQLLKSGRRELCVKSEWCFRPSALDPLKSGEVFIQPCFVTYNTPWPIFVVPAEWGWPGSQAGQLLLTIREKASGAVMVHQQLMEYFTPKCEYRADLGPNVTLRQLTWYELELTWRAPPQNDGPPLRSAELGNTLTLKSMSRTGVTMPERCLMFRIMRTCAPTDS